MSIDAVLCLVDTRLVEAAEFAAMIGTRHIAPETARLLRDKFSVRQRLAACGIVQPEFALARSNAELRDAVERLGPPVLVKPSDGYGSQNIYLLRDAADLDPFVGPVDTMLPARTDYGLGVRANDRLLVERFMEGPVIGCDVLTRDGQHQLLGVHEKLYFPSPSFAIRGGCFCPRAPEHAEIERYVAAALDAVGFDWGATHVELVLTTGGPQLIEINARLVGARMPRLIDLATGQRVHSALIGCHLGEAPATAPEESAGFAASRWLAAAASGTLHDIELPVRDEKRVRISSLLPSGAAIRPPLENADRLGCVMAVHPLRAEAERLAEAVVANARVRVRSDFPAQSLPDAARSA
jgi:biotin carboxylase